VQRITVGFGRGDRDSDLLASIAQRAVRLDVPLRVGCFAVRPSTALRGSIEAGAEELVVTEWAEALRMDIGLAIVAAGLDPNLVDVVVASGGSWDEAVAGVEWGRGDLLTIGASTSAVSRFFLGSHASKIVRSSPVPVLVVGRSR
jgi:nucleotide-binding universal stress UspA family protein